MTPRPLVATAAVLALGATLAVTPTSTAATDDKAVPQVTTLAKKLVSPLSLAVDPSGTRYFSQNFTGMLMRQVPGQAPEVVYTAKNNAEVGAVSVSGGVVTFAVSEGNNAKGTIMQMDAGGDVTKLARIHPVEKQLNPDGVVRYGFRHLTARCESRIPEGIPASYKGVPETHPYATTTVGGTTYLADAGANAVYKISADGTVSPLAVIPPARAVITRAMAAAQGLPKCVIGKAYYFESVPTDIEVGPNGKLYVTSLPGGPEDGSVGRLGRVFKVKPATGKVRKVVGGLLSPTGLAINAKGTMFVSEMFRGRIARIKPGKTKARTYLQVPLPSDVEIGPGGVYALVNALTGLEPGTKPRGKLILITP